MKINGGFWFINVFIQIVLLNKNFLMKKKIESFETHLKMKHVLKIAKNFKIRTE